MHKRITYILLLTSLHLVAKDLPNKITKHKPHGNETSNNSPVTVYVTVNPTINATSSSTPHTNVSTNSNQDSTVTSEAQSRTQVESTSSSESHAAAINFNYNYFPNIGAWGHSLTDFFARNKKRFIMGVIAATYGTIFYHVVEGNAYLRSKARWFAWHKEIPLKKLRQITYEQLMAELVYTVQKRHISTADPINFSAPLSTFMQELAQEEKALLFYQKLYRWCSRLWIRKLFPFDVKLYKRIGIRLRRIKFLRYRFMQWVTKYKIEHNQAFEKAVRLLHM